MKIFLILASALLGVFARPDGLLDGHDGYVSVTQSSIGTYKYAVNLKDSRRTEERHDDGTITGEYTITDANGVPQVIRYVAGKDGFNILKDSSSGAIDADVINGIPEEHFIDSQSNLVVPLEGSAPGFFSVPSVNVKSVDTTHNLLVPLEDTPEVKAAKQEFFASYNAALASTST